jgi:hypothetical protein
MRGHKWAIFGGVMNGFWQILNLALLGLISTLLVSGCGSTKQYVIAAGQDGSLVFEPRSKLRFALCGNCYMWGSEKSPHSKHRVLESGPVYVDVAASGRCFLWFLFIPERPWPGCSPSVYQPEQHEIYLTLGNSGREPIWLDDSAIRVVKAGSELPAILVPSRPAELLPEQSIDLKIVLESWNLVGRGYEIELSVTPRDEALRIPMERFTTTTFGLILLD